MTKIKTAMQDAGHRVELDSGISDAAMRTAVMIMGEPVATPTAEELGKLREYLKSGGMLLLFGDTGIDLPTYNNLLSGVGSTIQFTTITIGTTSALPDGQFTQSPSKISGTSLNVTSGNGTTGGTLVDNNYVRYEQIGGGYVVVFGDRIDHNDVISATNTSLLLNFVSVAVGPLTPVPTLSPALLLAISALLGGFALAHLARGRRLARRGA